MNLFNAFFYAAIAFALLDWIAAWKGWKVPLYIAKPGVMVMLALWTASVSGWQNGFLWFGIGLVAALLGDVLLMLPERFFLPGMLAFFAMQLSYLIGFNQTVLEFTLPVATAAIIVGLAASAVMRLLLPYVRKHVKSSRGLIPYEAYFIALTFMLLAAVLTLFRPDWLPTAAWLAAPGGLLLFASDSLLSYDRFARHLPHARFWVHLTYHLGQFGILSAALLHSLPH